MRLPRFRVRTLSSLVAAAALLLWAAMMGARSYDYAARARFYAGQESGWRQIAARESDFGDFYPRCIDYFHRLSAKYREAAWHPWAPVAPDPPAPGHELLDAAPGGSASPSPPGGGGE